MNGNTHGSNAQHVLTIQQRMFITLLLLLGAFLSYLIVRFLDPSTALTSHVASAELHRVAGDTVVAG